MSTLFGLLVLLVLVASSAPEGKKQPQALPVGALNDLDKQHFFKVFDGLDKESVKEVHYAVLGNAAFGRETAGISCSFISTFFDSDDLELQYHALSVASMIKGCNPKISKTDQLTDALKKESLTIDQLFYILSSAAAAKVKVDKSAVLKLLTNFSEKGKDPTHLSTLLASAVISGGTAKELESFAPLVKKLVEQADEADGTKLFFERGAYTTAFAVESIFRFAVATQKAPELTEQQLIKFANFLYGRRRAHHIRTASRVASVLKVLSSNAFMTPVVVYGKSKNERAGVSGILVPESRVVQLRVYNLLGAPVDAVSLQAGGLYRESPSSEPLLIGPSSHGDFKQDKDGLFVLDLKAKAPSISHGRYALAVTVSQSQKKTGATLVGLTDVRIPLRVVSPVKIEDAQFKLSDASKTIIDSPVQFPGMLSPEAARSAKDAAVRMQHNSRLRFRFTLVDAVTGDKFSPHQVFMQLTHNATLQSVTYLCKQSTIDQSYSFTLDVDGAAGDFGHVSGLYAMELIVGDFLLTKPVVWHITDVDLRLPLDADRLVGKMGEDVARLTVASVSGRKRAAPPHPLIGEGPRPARPELEHTFKQPEPRPSDFLAYTFTALCCVPFVVLLLMVGIFALYLLYWFKLNMFTTLRYLLFIGVVTFLSGNRLLRHLVNRRRKAE
ncbi:unnamed protein product [Mesocestoides corti]|uniref:Dolichyl-diphosphooligosaccharide--protein glycosyltransferase subunit 2 n=1 Tax=Mesocestoides corti TaxID=53468 RepID=A0A0R3UJL1_MESCO|nr:unnamed protein product [Mesocestoides corti]